MEGETVHNPNNIELPADLQVPTHAEGPPRVVTPDLSKTGGLPLPPLPNTPPDLFPAPRSHSRAWLGWVISLLAFVVVGATVYVLLTQIGFNRGKIKFTFEPTGVNLVIDQKLTKTAVSDLTLALKAGTHSIKVTKEGYLDFEQSFDIIQRETAEMNVVLVPIPDMELIAELPTTFPALVNQDQLLAYVDPNTGTFSAIELATENVLNLFEIGFNNLQKTVWSPSGVAAIIKLPNVWRVANMRDNRRALGQYIPLGGSPAQGPTLNNGVSTWLLDSARRTNAGIQPVLLNENVRDVIFSSDGTQIVYFYTAADGEKSLIRAENTDGSSWLRLATNVDANNPSLLWVNDDRKILLFDDAGKTDKIFDSVSQAWSDVMPDRVAGTLVESSPAGSRLLYVSNIAGSQRLAIWNTADQKTEKIFDKPITNFVWQDENTIIVATSDNNLWYWTVSGGEKPVRFASSFGSVVPQRLLYSALSQTLFVLDGSRIFSIKV